MRLGNLIGCRVTAHSACHECGARAGDSVSVRRATRESASGRSPFGFADPVSCVLRLRRCDVRLVFVCECRAERSGNSVGPQRGPTGYFK